VMTLTNIYFHYDVMTMTDQYAAAINAMATGEGICYPFRSFQVYQQPVLSAKSSLVIPHSSNGIEAFINVMVESDNQTVTTVNDKMLTYLNNQCQQFQLRINNEYFPLEPVFTLNDPQGYVVYLRWADCWRLGGLTSRTTPLTTSTEYNTNRFYIINDVETYPNEGLINPMSTTSAGNNVYLILQLAASPGVPTDLYTYAQYFNYIELKHKVLK